MNNESLIGIKRWILMDCGYGQSKTLIPDTKEISDFLEGKNISEKYINKLYEFESNGEYLIEDAIEDLTNNEDTRAYIATEVENSLQFEATEKMVKFMVQNGMEITREIFYLR